MKFIIFLFIKISMSFVFKPAWQNQGKGARVIRVVGNQYLKRLDPFLMLDYFQTKLPAGFPDHPHRGFQTITYMLQGKVYHEDFKGHKGVIGPGDVQWMTAGKGIVHAEMPASFEQMSTGFQLWLNLKSDSKMVEPKYQQYEKNQFSVYEKDGVKVKIICGQWEGKKGPIKYETPSIYIDIEILENGVFEVPVKAHWNTIIFSYKGNLIYNGGKKEQIVEENHCCVLEKGEEGQIIHKFKATQGSKFLLIGGQPLNQPVVSYGPFVMNTQEQIEQTFKDYQTYSNGFQNLKNWESKIKYLPEGKKYEEL